MDKQSIKGKFNKIIANVGYYYHPEYLREEYRSKLDTKDIDIKKIEGYFQLLSTINFFLNKIKGYDLYFSNFYPDGDSIKKTEALEHHIYAYLEYLDIFRNKVSWFLGTLKNDLKKIALNKGEIDFALKTFIDNMEKVFTQLKQNRHPHHHKGMKFLDPDLVNAQALQTILESRGKFLDTLTPDFLDQIEKKLETSFKKAQSNWIDLAKRNSEQMSGFIDEVFSRNEEFIYKVLDIKPTEDIFGDKN